MKQNEFSHIIAAILILTIVFGFSFILKGNLPGLARAFAFSVIIIFISIIVKKMTAYLLDSDVEHELWTMYHFGFKPKQQHNKPILPRIIFPLILSLISLGTLKFSPILTYETRALKHRASKRFGVYSYTEMTDFHNGLIGASGIVSLLIIAIISYIIPGTNIEYLSKIAAYYAFWNILPISKLDGTQIFFGSRILWSVLATIAAIFAFLAFTIIP